SLTRGCWEVRQGECLAALKQLPDAVARVAFTSLLRAGGVNVEWCRAWLGEVVRCLSDDGSAWLLLTDCQADVFGELLRSVGLHRRAWIKVYSRPGIARVNNFEERSAHLFYCAKDKEKYVFQQEALEQRRGE